MWAGELLGEIACSQYRYHKANISILLHSVDVCTFQCIMSLSGRAGTKVSEMVDGGGYCF